MAYQRGEVVFLPFLIPHNNKTEEHPAIIISNEDVHNNKDIYICVMISHSNKNSMFSFELSPEMFVNPNNAPSGAVKSHLVAYILSSHITGSSKNKMKTVYADKLVDYISDTVLR